MSPMNKAPSRAVFDLISKRQKVFLKYRDAFYTTFGRPLSDFMQCHTMAGVTLGFNVVKFDDQVVHSGDQAMIDAVRQHYGAQGVAILEGLLHEHQRTDRQGGRRRDH